jgi:Spy/CpxP family protein refolding chaperone
MKKVFLMSFAALALLATVSLVMAQPAQGQRQGGQGAGQGGQPRQQQAFAGQVLGIEAARTALNVTADQWEKLQAASAAVRAANPGPARTGTGGGLGAGANADPAARAAAMERQQKIAEETRKAVESILSADQVAKMDVMTFQRTGGLNPPAAPAPGTGAGPGTGGGFGGGGNAITVESLRALNLNAEQKAKVQAAIAKRNEASQPAAAGNRDPNAPQPTAEERAARREAQQKVSAEFFTAVKAALTPAQIAKSEELMKEVPEFLRPQPRGTGGPGAVGGGNRPAGGAGGGAGRGAARGTGGGN